MTSETTLANAAFVPQKPAISTNKVFFVEKPSESLLVSEDGKNIKLPSVEKYEPANIKIDKSYCKSLASILNVSSNILKRNRPVVVGHRGSLYRKLENTRASFKAAAAMGCDFVELDVFLLKCNTLVVFHGGGTDANPGLLDDYCGVPGSILDYTAEEARFLLRFNPNYLEFGCGKEYMMSNEALEEMYIPTLEEVLKDAKESGIKVKIELKGPGTAIPAVELVDNLNMVNQCEFSSFDHSQIHQVRELKPEVTEDGTHVYRTGALFASHVPDDFIDVALSVGASEVHLKYDTCTTDRIESIHDAGMGSMAWFRGPIGMLEDVSEKYFDVGNEDEEMYKVVMATGVQSMCINKPDVLLKLIEKLERSSCQEADCILWQ